MMRSYSSTVIRCVPAGLKNDKPFEIVATRLLR